MGIETYGLDWHWVLPLAVAGNLIPALIWLVALPRIGSYLVSFPNPVGRLISWRSGEIAATARRSLQSSPQHRFGPAGGRAITLYGRLDRFFGGVGLRDTFPARSAVYSLRGYDRRRCSHCAHRIGASPHRITPRPRRQVKRRQYLLCSTLPLHDIVACSLPKVEEVNTNFALWVSLAAVPKRFQTGHRTH